MSKFPVASKPLARPSNGLTDNNSSAGLLQPDEQEGTEENCLPASLALLLGCIISKFPAASKPLAWLPNRLPNENSSDHSHNLSAGLLQMDEEEGDVENCCPSSLALLLDYIMSKFPVAPKPLAQPSIWRFHVFGAAGFVLESSQRSSNISWFNHVLFACASTQSKFEPRFCEGESLSSIMPSVSKGHEVVLFALPGIGTQSHLPMIRLNELQTIGCQICPDVAEKCCGAGENLAECLGVLQVPVEDDDRFIQIFWQLRPDSPGAVAFVATRRGESFLCHMVPSVPEAQKRNLFQILSSNRRIYLCLPLLTQLDMPQGMCPYIKDHSLGLPRCLGRLRGGPFLRLRHPGDAFNLRLLLLCRSALKPPLLRSVLRPRRSRPIPRGGFRG